MKSSETQIDDPFRRRGPGTLVGLLLALLAAAALGMTAISLQPRQEGSAVMGEVLAMGLTETRSAGSLPVATVGVADRQASVRLRRDTACRAGSIIAMRRARVLGLTTYTADLKECNPQPAAAGAMTARAFTERLYEAYDTRQPDYVGREAAAVFAPPLLSLIREDQHGAAGFVGRLDWNPICGCQDDDGLKLMALQLGARGPAAAIADVTLRLEGGEARLRLDLVRTAAGWRVADVHTAKVPSLAARLQGR